MPRCCAFRTNSSTSPNWYAGSNGSVACAGRSGATFDQSTIVRRIDALFERARSIASSRVPSHRSTGSSWKPTHMRSAPAAAGTRTAAERHAKASKRTMNRTRTSLSGFGEAGTVAPPRKGGVKVAPPRFRRLAPRACLDAGPTVGRSRRLDGHGLGGRLHARPAQDPPRLPLHGRLVGDPGGAARRAADRRRPRSGHTRVAVRAARPHACPRSGDRRGADRRGPRPRGPSRPQPSRTPVRS